MPSPFQPRRIAYFVSHPIQYQAPLLRLLAARPEIELEVFFYSDFSLAAYHDSEFGRTVSWDVPLTEGYRHTFLDRRRGGIQSLLRDGRFDVVWVHGWAHRAGIQAIRAARRLGIATMLRGETNGLARIQTPTGWRGGMKRRLREIFLRWLFRQVDGFLAVGTLNRRFYEGFEIAADRIFSVPYVVDNAFFQRQAAAAHPHREKLRAELGLPQGRPVILFTAKLIEKKRPADVLDAFRRLSPDGVAAPPACLLFVGDGPLAPALHEAAKRTGWDAVRFAGFRNQSEIPAFYDLCDVFVLPSDFEPWGLVVNEAMNAARPIIASDRVGSAADLVLPGVNGFVYPAGDVAALAERLRETLAAPTRRAEMGLASRALIDRWGLSEAVTGIMTALASLRPAH